MSQPNFLIILADDLGFSDLGSYGGEIETPNIDQLASEGIRFTDFHSSSACSPTRSMILSGTDHHVAGIGTMSERLGPHHRGKPGYEGYLNDRVAALPEVLGRHGGYETLMSGKWHLGQSPDRTPHARGFERSFSLLVGCHNHYGWEPSIAAADDPADIPRLATIPRSIYQEDASPVPVSDLPPNFYSSDSFTDKLLGYLQDRHTRSSSSSSQSNSAEEPQRPFFAYLAFSAPHWPLQAPRANIEKYRGKYDQGPSALRNARLSRMKAMNLVPPSAVPTPVILRGESGEDHLPWEEEPSREKRRMSSRAMEAYAGVVDRLDWNVGRVVRQLKSTGEYDNTCILVLSDNGAEGAMWEAQPLAAGGNLMEHIARYHDNSYENVGARDSFIWYGPQWAQASTAPSRLFKLYTSEGGIRVPCILKAPSGTAVVGLDKKEEVVGGGGRGGEEEEECAGRIDHAFGTVMDIMPTFLDMAGIGGGGGSLPLDGDGLFHGRKVAPMKGRSWIPYLTGREDRIHDDDEITGWELFGRMALRKGDYKILFIPKPHGPERWQLFNLVLDPGETEDLAEREPGRLEDMLKAFQGYCLDNGVILQDEKMRDDWDRSALEK